MPRSRRRVDGRTVAGRQEAGVTWRRLRQGFLAAGFCLALISAGAAQGRQPSPATHPSAPALEVEVARGLLTLHADGAPLVEVLRAIGRAGRFEVVLHGGFATPVRESFVDRPLGDAIEELVAGDSLAIVYGAPDPVSGKAAVVRIAVIEYRSAANAGSAPPPPGEADDDLARHRARLRVAPEAGSPAAREAIESAVRAFANADASGRSRAVAALTRLEGPDVRRLLRGRALADDDAEVRAQAVNVLARSEGERAINVLAQALRQDPEPEVRINAARALGRIGGERARRILVDAARDLDPATSLAARRALAARPDPRD